MSQVKFGIWCSGENRQIGTLAVAEGSRLTSQEITIGYTPDRPEYAGLDTKDRRQATCPRCKNNLLLTDEGTPGKGVYLIPGSWMKVQAP